MFTVFRTNLFKQTELMHESPILSMFVLKSSFLASSCLLLMRST